MTKHKKNKKATHTTAGTRKITSSGLYLPSHYKKDLPDCDDSKKAVCAHEDTLDFLRETEDGEDILFLEPAKKQDDLRNSTWDTNTGIPLARECTYAKCSETYSIYIPLSIYKVIRKVCATIKLEWQMLLGGVLDEAGKMLVVDSYYIPKQTVSGASVDNLDIVDSALIQSKSLVCTIHSHANMQVFFSSTDNDCTNMSQIRHHIVTNNKDEYKAVSRVSLPCGHETFTEAEVIIEDIPEDTVRVDGLENIQKKKYLVKGNYHKYDWYKDYPPHSSERAESQKETPGPKWRFQKEDNARNKALDALDELDALKNARSARSIGDAFDTDYSSAGY